MAGIWTAAKSAVAAVFIVMATVSCAKGADATSTPAFLRALHGF